MSDPVAFEPETFRLQPGESHTLSDGTRFVRRVAILGSGTKVWCNVEYAENGTCLGADAHWLSPRLADEAIVSHIKDLEAGAR